MKRFAICSALAVAILFATNSASQAGSFGFGVGLGVNFSGWKNCGPNPCGPGFGGMPFYPYPYYPPMAMPYYGGYPMGGYGGYQAYPFGDGSAYPHQQQAVQGQAVGTAPASQSPGNLPPGAKLINQREVKPGENPSTPPKLSNPIEEKK